MSQERAAFLECLVCPRCSGSLSAQADALQCNACGHSCPIIGGIPWLYPFPAATHAEWQSRYNFFLQSLDNEVELIKGELRRTDLLVETADRLRRVLQAKVEHGKSVRKLLEPVGAGGEGSLELSMAGKVKLPENQSLMAYYANVLRDWSWEGDENTRCLQAIDKVVPAGFKPASMVVFGAGACRLPVDLHEQWQPKVTVAFDINPFLFLAARKILKGQSLTLYEFPMAPREREGFAIARKCKRVEGEVRAGFHLVHADALNAPAKSASFDAALTPWFIDIVPQDFRDFARRVNHVLRMGGTWVNFGSLAFFHRSQAMCYSRGEALKVLEGSGFRVLSVNEDLIPYLHSPASCQERWERVFCFAVEKIADVPAPAPFGFLPEWLTDHDIIVPLLPEFERLILVNRTYADIVSLVDGRRSVAQVAAVLAPQLALTPEFTCGVVAALLTNVYESTLRGGQF